MYSLHAYRKLTMYQTICMRVRQSVLQPVQYKNWRKWEKIDEGEKKFHTYNSNRENCKIKKKLNILLE